MVGCHGWLPWLAAMVGCHGWLPWLAALGLRTMPLIPVICYLLLYVVMNGPATVGGGANALGGSLRSKPPR